MKRCEEWRYGTTQAHLRQAGAGVEVLLLLRSRVAVVEFS